MPKGFPCTGAPDNAVAVTQTVDVPTTFMRLFGFNKLTVSATATASMQGIAQPWNVAIIIDSTGSMNAGDSNCGGLTEFQCALTGIQGLLAATNPACPPGSSNCPTGANFRVSMFTFPNITTATVTDDINCGGIPGGQGQPVATPYTLPLPTATSYAPMTYTPTSKDSKGHLLPPWTSTYELTYGANNADANGFLNDYYLASDVSGLNPDSDLVKIVGRGGPKGTPGCLTYPLGILNSGIGNTYYAGAIYAAQSALVAEQAANPGSRNAIIFLSDGQANIDKNQFPQAAQGSGIRPSPTTAETYGVPATVSADQGLYTLTKTGLYPDSNDECQQAIMAAVAATQAGTTVYGVAYGAEQSGCGKGATDSLVVIPPGTTLNASVSPLSSFVPCTTIEDISSSLSTFYSDWLQSGGSVSTACTDSSHSVVSLSSIFQSIAASFTTPRLLPNDAK
jgi:hypothetical protein